MMLSLSSFARTCSLLPRANARASRHRHPSVLCFREDDTSPEFFPAVIRELPSAVLEFTPGGRFRRFQQPGEICSTSSNDWGSGNNNNDDGSNRRGWRGHGDNNNSGEKHSSLVAARVLLAFSAFHLGYCIAAWMRKDGDKLGIEFYGVGLGLVCFLATAAVFVSLGAVSSEKLVAIWTCLAAMIATAEKCFFRKHRRLSGFVLLFGISTVATLCV
ncbi:uncharacterized protein LOC9656954 [Selaginella moellendorffii]|uniref:uncharacterized protein LOC9656954 n=1 Tax=Selaginella moellendorffii TaxID=88036 RepID=UPI000D1CE539|nr:uncharacterized protein LOC9656954 [Selaginella moellendorffii]|eukprot:XP_024540710.1 uncharacterized protein LOC9656954 [Selaginella moellendorffii]